MAGVNKLRELEFLISEIDAQIGLNVVQVAVLVLEARLH